jgi:hypothetical protein
MSTPTSVAEVPPSGGWRPTKKWIGSLVTGVAGVLASWIVTGAFDDVERGMSATLLTALATAYFVTNDKTPGGVPDAS